MAKRRSTVSILAAAFLLGGLLTRAGAALAACGDGIVDLDEQCDDGPQNGHDACCSMLCEIVDSDYDGTCDALDPCESGQGTRLKEATLTIGRLSTPPGDDTLRLTGTITVPSTPPIDPSVSGVRLRMFAPGGDPSGMAIMDATVPGGSKWNAHADGASWTYRDTKGSAGGIRRVDVKLRAPLVPTTRLTTVAFTISGRRGDYPITPDMVTSEIVDGLPHGNFLQVVFALGATGATAGTQCGERWYSSTSETRCLFAPSGDRTVCSGPPPVGPCHIGDPDDLEICDLLNVARAEDRYFAAHGSYFGGSCTDLPGFVASPGVGCSTAVKTGGFTATTSHPSALRLNCIWDSAPLPGGQNLVCS